VFASPRLKRLWFTCHQAAIGVARATKNERKHFMTNDTESSTGKSPSHHAYQVRDRDGGKGFWTRVGAAWAHGDGKGFSIQLDAVPLDGRITLRVASEKKDQ